MLALVALIIISLCIAVFFLVLFIRAVKKDQFKDTYTPSVRMLFDDTEIKNNSNS
jgi:cbb3-type cytochrome oxidase maturation protein